MTRKKQNSGLRPGEESAEAATAVAEPPQQSAAETQAQGDENPPKNWGPPYKSIFVCRDKGFEMGEDRRFRQRVFKFFEKPAEDVLAALKEHGFIYRPAEKAWTITATAENRLLTDRLAQSFAGQAQGPAL